MTLPLSRKVPGWRKKQRKCVTFVVRMKGASKLVECDKFTETWIPASVLPKAEESCPSSGQRECTLAPLAEVEHKRNCWQKKRKNQRNNIERATCRPVNRSQHRKHWKQRSSCWPSGDPRRLRVLGEGRTGAWQRRSMNTKGKLRFHSCDRLHKARKGST